ncbi:TorD/DmsD family molecular chaperone [Sulfurospirillum arsenophilum]|uniref:TorD/DmsD family molecular chaperone n=1 Tax=Sulfurospirillum arsenophilum TaxID=56698 RepID=UPI0005A665EB|nr:molecular chaperone TorD family protein [Sulfurospirillum arsenophilum]
MKNLEFKYHFDMANIYDLLRDVFFNQWTHDSIQSMLQKTKLLHATFGKSAFINKLQSLESEKLDFARWEYNRLFIGPRKPLAPPFESVYRSDKKLQMQHFAFEVREYYAQVGLEVELKNQFPDDFIGFEFQYLFYISRLIVEALSEGKDDEKKELLIIKQEFLKNHPNQWMNKFCNDILTESKEEIWKNLAELIIEVLHKEDEMNRKYFIF